jgi:hypothetical protein
METDRVAREREAIPTVRGRPQERDGGWQRWFIGFTSSGRFSSFPFRYSSCSAACSILLGAIYDFDFHLVMVICEDDYVLCFWLVKLLVMMNIEDEWCLFSSSLSLFQSVCSVLCFSFCFDLWMMGFL